MNKSTELKRCPFCGGEAHICLLDKFVCVSCTECENSLYDKNVDKIIARWNNRPLEDEAYEAGLQQGAAQALSRSAGLSDWQRVDCIGKEIQANETGTGGPKVY